MQNGQKAVQNFSTQQEPISCCLTKFKEIVYESSCLATLNQFCAKTLIFRLFMSNHIEFNQDTPEIFNSQPQLETFEHFNILFTFLPQS